MTLPLEKAYVQCIYTHIYTSNVNAFRKGIYVYVQYMNTGQIYTYMYLCMYVCSRHPTK